MALLGNGGILELSREWPDPMALAETAVIHSTTPSRISLGNTDYWTGDRIILNFPGGSPFNTGNANGAGVYFGSIYVLSQARQHVTGPNANYYQVDNSVAFYDKSHCRVAYYDEANSELLINGVTHVNNYNGEPFNYYMA